MVVAGSQSSSSGGQYRPAWSLPGRLVFRAMGGSLWVPVWWHRGKVVWQSGACVCATPCVTISTYTITICVCVTSICYSWIRYFITYVLRLMGVCCMHALCPALGILLRMSCCWHYILESSLLTLSLYHVRCSLPEEALAEVCTHTHTWSPPHSCWVQRLCFLQPSCVWPVPGTERLFSRCHNRRVRLWENRWERSVEDQRNTPCRTQPENCEVRGTYSKWTSKTSQFPVYIGAY